MNFGFYFIYFIIRKLHGQLKAKIISAKFIYFKADFSLLNSQFFAIKAQKMKTLNL